MAKPKAKTFRATLERLRSDLGWVIVRLPFDVRETWGTGRLKVCGEVNGVSFRTSLFPQKDGGHFILVNNKIQKAARIFLGNTAGFRLELDTEPRVVAVPPEFELMLRQSRKVRAFFESLTFSYRKAISTWVSEPKSVASRRRRAEQIAERLLETMEAEHRICPQPGSPRRMDAHDAPAAARRIDGDLLLPQSGKPRAAAPEDVGDGKASGGEIHSPLRRMRCIQLPVLRRNGKAIGCLPVVTLKSIASR